MKSEHPTRAPILGKSGQEVMELSPLMELLSAAGQEGKSVISRANAAVAVVKSILRELALIITTPIACQCCESFGP